MRDSKARVMLALSNVGPALSTAAVTSSASHCRSRRLNAGQAKKGLIQVL